MEYLVRRARVTPEFKGDWDGPAWRDAAIASITHFHAQSSSHRPTAEAKLLYDDFGMYVHFRVRDRYVVCRHTQPQSPVCRDSCVEAFLQPKPDAGYFNFEVNCGGAILLYYITESTRIDGKIQGFRPVETKLLQMIRIFHSMPCEVTPEMESPTEWSVEYFVPNELFEAHVGELEPPQNRRWRGNFYKCADDSSHPHWASWSPIGAALNFHVPAHFASIRFES
jgi:hypothetical protein